MSFRVHADVSVAACPSGLGVISLRVDMVLRPVAGTGDGDHVDRGWRMPGASSPKAWPLSTGTGMRSFQADIAMGALKEFNDPSSVNCALSE